MKKLFFLNFCNCPFFFYLTPPAWILNIFTSKLMTMYTKNGQNNNNNNNNVWLKCSKQSLKLLRANMSVLYNDVLNIQMRNKEEEKLIYFIV